MGSWTYGKVGELMNRCMGSGLMNGCTDKGIGG